MNTYIRHPAVSGLSEERGAEEDYLFWGNFQLTSPDASSARGAEVQMCPFPGASL